MHQRNTNQHSVSCSHSRRLPIGLLSSTNHRPPSLIVSSPRSSAARNIKTRNWYPSTLEKTKSKNSVIDMTNSGILENKNNVKEKRQLKTSLFVKLNMDGIPIGRKVDLNAHNYYETLAQTLEDMSCRPTTTISVRRELFFSFLFDMNILFYAVFGCGIWEGIWKEKGKSTVWVLVLSFGHDKLWWLASIYADFVYSSHE
ncbi:hypothetical protein ACSBR1_017891 [Camellia fascicularis]